MLRSRAEMVGIPVPALQTRCGDLWWVLVLMMLG
jgi:hypothetical protein